MHVTMEDARTARADFPRWHLVLTKPLGELVCVANLERQGYEVYFPRLQQKLLRRGRWIERIAPLFPRYLFVALSSSACSLSPIRSTVGVASVVRFGVDYITVPSRIIADLRRKEDPETGLHSLQGGSWFKCGDRVVIAAGSLAGMEGIFESEDANHRVTILLNLLGQETRVQLSSGCLAESAA